MPSSPSASVVSEPAEGAEVRLVVRGLRKTYGDFVALESLDFEVRAGQIFGLLGPNGAGKSTTIRCVCGLLRPTGGSIVIGGFDLATRPLEARSSLGVVPQELALFEELTGRQNLSYWASIHGLRRRRRRQDRVDEVLDAVGLSDRADDRVSSYSGGMKRRLNFACGLVHRPRVLLLDEPTVAVDPHSRRRLLDLVQELASTGTAIVYTTHYMEEAQELCDELAIVDRGRRVAHGSLDALRRQIDDRDLLTLRGDFPVDATRPVLARRGADATVHEAEDRLVLSLPDASSLLAGLLGELSAAGAVVREVSLARPNLESLFLRLTGRQLRQ